MWAEITRPLSDGITDTVNLTLKDDGVVTDIIKDIRIGLVNSTTNPMVQYPIPVAKPIQKGVEYQLQMEILILFVVEFLSMAVWKLLKIN